MSPTSDDPFDHGRDRVRFTVSASTAIKFGFFAAVGVTAFAVVVGGVLMALSLAAAALGVFTLPVVGR